MIRTACWMALVGAATFFWGSQPAAAVVIRHDVPDQDYIDLSTGAEYEAVGLWSSPACSTSSATLISPEWLLTAAHCVPTNPNATTSFTLGPSSSSPELTVAGETWFRHDLYNPNNIQTGRDFGLVKLAEPILDVTPAQIYRASAELGKIGTLVAYGRTGTGLTGQQNGTQGVRRGATNRLDVFGTIINGGSTRVLVGDFDNPDNPGDSLTGSNVPTDLEGMVAFFDSGGAWFIESAGVTYFAAVTSFNGQTDGPANDVDADYGDFFGAGRTTSEQAWIDSNANVATFWTAFNATWTNGGNWDVGTVPDSTKTVVVKQGTATINSTAEAEYLFVDGTGRLRMNAQLDADQVIVKRGGTFQVGFASGGVQLLTGGYRQTTGTFDLVIHASNERGELASTSVVELDGQLTVSYRSGYEGPATRGQVDLHNFISAVEVQGQFDDVDGIPIGTTMTYAGETKGNLDGLFRSLDYSSSLVTLAEYLALPGDANGDGSVDVNDFNIWNANRFATSTDWSTADFNGDGTTDLSDLHIWNENKGTSVSLPMTLSVPEPDTILGALFGMAAVLGFYRRKT